MVYCFLLIILTAQSGVESVCAKHSTQNTTQERQNTRGGITPWC